MIHVATDTDHLGIGSAPGTSERPVATGICVATLHTGRFALVWSLLF